MPIALLVAPLLFMLVSPVPMLASPSLDGVTVLSHSQAPGAQTVYDVSFVTSEGLDGLTDTIIMELHEAVGVPASLRPSALKVSYSEGSSLIHGHVDDIHLSGQSDPGEPTTISFAPHVDDDGTPADKPGGAMVTVSFTEAAEVSHPVRGGAYSWRVRASKEPDPVAAVHPDNQVRLDFRDIYGYVEDEGLVVERTVSLSRNEAVRRERVAVTTPGCKR